MWESIPWLQVIVTLLLIALTKTVYTYIIKPYKLYNYYAKLLREHYKTKVEPFTILGTNHLTRRKKELQLYNDIYYTAKTELPHYQVRLMKVGSDVLIDLIDNQLIKEYLEKTKEWYYIKDRDFPGLSSLKSIVGEGLFLSEGDAWKKKKKILSKIFQHEFIISQIPVICGIVDKNFQELESTPENLDKNTIAADFSTLFPKIFGGTVIKSFFGELQSDKIDGQNIYEFVSKTLLLNSKRSLTLFAFLFGNNFYKYNLRAIDREVNQRGLKFTSFCEGVITNLVQKFKQEKEKGGASYRNGGIIDWVIKNDLLAEEGEDATDKYTVKELIDEVATFFLAGTDTTSVVTSTLLYTLSKRPEIVKKLRMEILEVMGSSLPSEDLLKKCSYLQCVMRQALRMFMPAPNLTVREVLRDHYLGNIPLKRGVKVTMKIISNHYNQQFYKNPLEFNPERWLDIQPGKMKLSSFLPFSFGHRVCIGQHLAVLQAKITLIQFLRRYQSIQLERNEFKLVSRFNYGAEIMLAFLTKSSKEEVQG